MHVGFLIIVVVSALIRKGIEKRFANLDPWYHIVFGISVMVVGLLLFLIIKIIDKKSRAKHNQHK